MATVYVVKGEDVGVHVWVGRESIQIVGRDDIGRIRTRRRSLRREAIRRRG